MSNTFRKSTRDYCIYCIVDRVNKHVHVEKTCSKNPRDHYNSHLRGEHKLTAGVFTEKHARPEFVVLEYIKCTHSMACKHVVAWYCFFNMQFDALGLWLVCEEYLGDMIDNPTGIIKEIYDTVCAPLTLKEVLTRTVSKSEDPGDRKTCESPSTQVSKSTQLNIRVNEEVKNAFKQFCDERKLTQSDALGLLLLGQDFEYRNVLMQSFEQKQKELEQEATEFRRLYEELLIVPKAEKALAVRRKEEWIKIAKEILAEVLECSLADSDYLALIGKKRVEVSSLSNDDAHDAFFGASYPTEGGVAMIYLERLVYGNSTTPWYEQNNAPLFVIGRTNDGMPIKLRWYKRKDFIGKHPDAWGYSYAGSQWLVGYIISDDKAANLVAAIPYDSIPDPIEPDDELDLCEERYCDDMELKYPLFASEAFYKMGEESDSPCKAEDVLEIESKPSCEAESVSEIGRRPALDSIIKDAENRRK